MPGVRESIRELALKSTQREWVCVWGEEGREDGPIDKKGLADTSNTYELLAR